MSGIPKICHSGDQEIFEYPAKADVNTFEPESGDGNARGMSENMTLQTPEPYEFKEMSHFFSSKALLLLEDVAKACLP